MHRSFRAVPAALAIASLSALLLSRGGHTVPLYAARTGNMCQTCHFDPNGGGPRNDFGFAYARRRHSLDEEPEGSPWKDLALTNRIGETMPVYVGVNHRFMLLTNKDATPGINRVDRFGFFNMENSLELTFQPHARLALVYTRDGFNAGSRSADAFGILSGYAWNGYLKAGRFRNPFGLRMDDHTVATRNSFLDLSTSPFSPARFLPYDPREPDMGIEIGANRLGFFGRVAFTNGDANVLASEFAEAKALKFGYNSARFQGALSFYDAYHKVPGFDVFGSPLPKRATRWGGYGMTHWGPVTVLGEVAAGTDEAEPVIPGKATGAKTNRLAYFAEANFTPFRHLNIRLRGDRLEYDRSSDKDVLNANTHNRYAIESEYVPMPFAELRATLRRIDHEDEKRFGHGDETQGYVQFHFSY